jgi:hypothetical protein
MADAHKNFAYSTVSTAPAPATTGTSLVVAAGQGALMPTPPFNATVWPEKVQPTAANAEIVRVTGVATDTLTIERKAESTTAQSIAVGYQIAASITAKTLVDAETVTLAQLAAAQPVVTTIPENYGALKNGVVISDAETKAASKIVTAPTSKPFTAASVGMYIAITAAGANITGEENNSLTSKITKFTSSSEVEIETAASSTVKGALALFGSDDTAAIQTAINEAVTKCQANGTYYCEVWFSQSIYVVAGALKTSQKGNAQITLPLIPSTLAGTTAQGAKVTIMLRGSSDSTSLPQWYQKVPQQTGSCIFSMGPFSTGKLNSHQPTYSESEGRPSVIGGPAPEQGYVNLEYSNMMFKTTGLTMSGVQNTTMTGLELNGVSEASIETHAAYALGIPGLGLTRAANPNIFVKPKAGVEGTFKPERPAVSVAMPGRGNNDNSYVGSHSVEGWCAGIEPSEHGWHPNTRAFYCWIGVALSGYRPWEYGTLFGLLSLGACRIGIYSAQAEEKGIKFRVLFMDVEENFIDILDEHNSWIGDVYFINQEGGKPKVENAAAGMPKWLKVINGELTAGPITPPSIPATTVALVNPFFRDAFVNVIGGTVSKIEVNGVEWGTTSGMVPVPSGASIKLTYSVVPTSWKWTLM